MNASVTKAAIDALERMCPDTCFVELDDQGRPRMVRLEAAPRAETLGQAIAAVAREQRPRAEVLEDGMRALRQLVGGLRRIDVERARIKAAKDCGAIPYDTANDLFAIQRTREAEVWGNARRAIERLHDEAPL